MSFSAPSRKHRSYLLPAGCKNIGELVKSKARMRQFRFNGLIKAPRVELRDESGNSIGIVPLGKALELARRSGVDLVEVNPKTSPPVCVLVDFGKLKYRLQNRQFPKEWK